MPGPIRNVAQDFNEAVVAPVRDEVGKMVEQGMQKEFVERRQPRVV